MTSDGSHVADPRATSDPVTLLRRQLDVHVPADEVERAHLATLAARLDDLDAPLDEHADATHVTGSAIVLANDASARSLLVHHRRLHRWLQPGGHVDPGETVHATAAREATEETGLAVAHPAHGPVLVHVDVHDGGRGHTHLDVRYVLLADPAQPLDPDEGESRRLGWFGDDEVAERSDRSVTVALGVARARIAATAS